MGVISDRRGSATPRRHRRAPPGGRALSDPPRRLDREIKLDRADLIRPTTFDPT